MDGLVLWVKLHIVPARMASLLPEDVTMRNGPLLRSVRIILLLCLCLTVREGLTDAPADWNFLAFDAARAQAITKNRPLFVYFGRYGCPTCARVNHESLTDPEVHRRYHEHYVLAYVDAESGERLRLPNGERVTEMDLGIRYEVFGTPFFFFMKPDGETITRIPGFVSVAQFLVLDLYVHGGHYHHQTLEEFVSGDS